VNLMSLDIYRYSLPLRRPLALKGATLWRREGLLLRLTGNDGSQGWGESAPLPGFSKESLDESAEQLRLLARSLMGREVTGDWVNRDGAFGREMDRTDPAPSVRFGLETAVWNLYASHAGKEFPELVTPSPRKGVPVNGLIPGPPANALEEARRMRDAGYRSIKLKVGAREIAQDIGLVRGLGEEIGDGISLRLDANRSWGYEAAARFMRGVVEVPFQYIEEPLTDPGRLPELVHEFGVPVALDESLVGMEPEDLVEHPYARAVVLKPTLLGGILRTLRMAERALRLGMTPVISSAYEGGVGTASLVALAAGIGDRPVAAGLDTYRALAGDVLDRPLALPAPSVDVGETVDASRRVEVRGLDRI
jgi:o-succinylbenzoate synthase